MHWNCLVFVARNRFCLQYTVYACLRLAYIPSHTLYSICGDLGIHNLMARVACFHTSKLQEIFYLLCICVLNKRNQKWYLYWWKERRRRGNEKSMSWRGMYVCILWKEMQELFLTFHHRHHHHHNIALWYYPMPSFPYSFSCSSPFTHSLSWWIYLFIPVFDDTLFSSANVYDDDDDALCISA